ncbi:NAD(P)H-hydrate dehydratase [Streptomyces sp. NPDC005438]|uniref:NAD(P)H-hydrate dehydratase n=1 Tax=Streptomyces sp. NPDC005438 TaxID=3156880 RepID=UPI00339DBB17
MRTAYLVETVRAAEGELMARLPEGTLMARAASGLAAACRGLLPRTYGSRVVLLVGSGDNGGDALYAGAGLARRGAGVTAVLLSPERTHAGGLRALRAAGGRAVAGPEASVGGEPAPVEALLQRADLVVDGIVGIGGRGGLRPDAEHLVWLTERAGVPIVAVDLPSGVDADTGEVHGAAVRAAATVTFGTHKPGLLVDPARSHMGALRLVDIGLDPFLPPERTAAVAYQHPDVAALLPRPGEDSDKYRRGVVGVVAGSARYPGAALLAVAGALRGGAGAVRFVGEGADEVVRAHPETLVARGRPSRAGRVQSWVVGPGLGDGPEAREAVAELLAEEPPLLVDADGLRLAGVDALRARTGETLLTPHAGEAAALLGVPRERVEAERLSSVRELARRTGATVLLKGSTTLVAPPDERPVLVNPTGSPWLATAGSGDVLSGLAGSLLATGLSAYQAGGVGAYLHGVAGRLARHPGGATEVAEALPAAWAELTGGLDG